MRHKLVPLVGVVFFATLLASALTGGNLSNDSSGAKVLAYYSSHRDTLIASMILTVVAVFFGIIYFGVLRDHLGEGAGMRGVTATAFGAALIFAAGGALSAGTIFALINGSGKLAPATAQTLQILNDDGGTGFVSCGLSVLLFCYGLAIVRSGLLPKWLGWIAFPFALIAFVPEIAWVSFIASGFWVLGTSIALYLRQSKANSGPQGQPAHS